MKRVIDINLLKENPLSKKLFGALPDKEFALLKQDIKDRGIQIPIEVTPDYTIITGGQRSRAKKALGAKEIEVIVREDLKSEEEIELHAIKDNLLRRHLTLEHKVLIVKYLVEKYGGLRGRPPKGGQVAPFLEGKGKTREKIAKLLGVSKRSVDKYLKIAELPEKEKQMVLKKGKRMKDVLAEDGGKEILAVVVPEETEQPFEGESPFEDALTGGFDPAAEIEDEIEKECVGCGRTTYLTLAEEDDPLQFLCRLIGEFVKSSEKILCHHCLRELYRHLGFYLQNNWGKIVKTTSLSNS